MKWVCLFMSIRLKRNFQKIMRRYGTLDKTHTNRVRMVFSFATNLRKDKDKPNAAKAIEWFLYNNKCLVLKKIIAFCKRVRFI